MNSLETERKKERNTTRVLRNERVPLRLSLVTETESGGDEIWIRVRVDLGIIIQTSVGSAELRKGGQKEQKMAGSGRVGSGEKPLNFIMIFFFLKLWFNRKPAPIRFGCSIKPKFKKKAGLPSIQPEKPETEMIEPVLLNQ